MTVDNERPPAVLSKMNRGREAGYSSAHDDDVVRITRPCFGHGFAGPAFRFDCVSGPRPTPNGLLFLPRSVQVADTVCPLFTDIDATPRARGCRPNDFADRVVPRGKWYKNIRGSRRPVDSRATPTTS